MKILYFYILLFFYCTSCVTEVPLPVTSNTPPKPVVHLFICPDSPLITTYYLSAPIKVSSEPVSNGYISYFLNQSFQDYLMEINPGKYTTGFNAPKPLDSFKFEIGQSAPEFSIYGKIPNHFSIEKVDTQNTISPQNGNVLNFRLTFTDSAKYDNYYKLYLRYFYKEYKLNSLGIVIDSIVKNKIINIESSDLAFELNHFNNYTGTELLFTDEIFNGARFGLNFSSSENFKKTINIKPLKIQVVLENLDPVLYRYYNTRNAHIWQQNSITQLPGPLEGNIPRGYGVIGAYTIKSYYIEF